MSLFTLPTATAVLDDSGLRTSQIKGTYTADNAEDDATEKILEQAGRVETRILKAATPYHWPFTDAQIAAAYPSYDAGQRSDYSTRQANQAALATKYFAIAALYRRSGQGQKRYEELADKWQAEGEKILSGDGDSDTGLLGTIAWVAQEQPGDNAPSEVQRRSSSVSQRQVWVVG